MERFSKYVFLTLPVLVAIAASALTNLVLSSQNTLQQNGHWTVGKGEVQMALAGAFEFETTRSPLAGGRLDLSRGHGFHSVYLKKQLDFSELQFQLRLSPSAYIDVLWSEMPGEGGEGLRLASTGPSFWFNFDRSGEFTFKSEPIKVPSAFWSKSVSLSEVSVDHSSSLQLKINGESVGSREGEFKTAHVGFRGSFHPSSIDSVRIFEGQNLLFEEKFENSAPLLRAFLIHFFILSFCIWLLAELRTDSRSRRERMIRTALTATLLVIVLCAFDHFFWSHRHFPDPRFAASVRPTLGQSLEEARKSLFSSWSRGLGGFASRREPQIKPGLISDGPISCSSATGTCQQGIPTVTAKERKFRFLLIGGSFSVGAGADHLEETFFVRLHQALAELHRGSLVVESLNLSRVELPFPLTTESLDFIRVFQPDLILMESRLGISSFEASTQLAIEQIQKTGIPHFVFHTMGLDRSEDPSLERVFGGGTDFDLSRQLIQAEQAALGFIFWDKIHLTSFGHRLAAEALAPHVLGRAKSDNR